MISLVCKAALPWSPAPSPEALLDSLLARCWVHSEPVALSWECGPSRGLLCWGPQGAPGASVLPWPRSQASAAGWVSRLPRLFQSRPPNVVPKGGAWALVNTNRLEGCRLLLSLCEG